MKLQARVEQLEAALVPDREVRDIVRIIVPAKGSRAFGTEGGVQRIGHGDAVWHRQVDETEAEFIERVQAAAPDASSRRRLHGD